MEEGLKLRLNPRSGREYNEKNVRYESAVVLPGSSFKSFSDSWSVVSYKGVDVYVFKSEEEASDWLNDQIYSRLSASKKDLIRICKSVAGTGFSLKKYVDWESLMKHMTSRYDDPLVVPPSFKKMFKSSEEGKKYIYDNIVNVVDNFYYADYRLSSALFDHVDFQSLMDDLKAHLGIRVFKQGSFYYVIDVFDEVLK